MLTTVNVTLSFPKYIAHPYTTERNDLINIQKKSGMNMARTEATRNKKLLQYLEVIKITKEDYDLLVKKCESEFYFNKEGFIYIPRHCLAGMFVEACCTGPSAIKLNHTNFRSDVEVSDFITTKKKADGVFGRFVPIKDGKGNMITNQRQWQQNQHILDFEAKGQLSFDNDVVETDRLKALLEYAGSKIGVGASRKMAYGRFKVTEWIVT